MTHHTHHQEEGTPTTIGEQEEQRGQREQQRGPQRPENRPVNPAENPGPRGNPDVDPERVANNVEDLDRAQGR